LGDFVNNAIKIDKTWGIYKTSSDAAAKEQLIVHYAPMIKLIAGKMSIYVGNVADLDDLVSYGIFGLIDAIEKFDYQKGAKFETYASLRIRGAILDGLRSLDWVPRTLRQKHRRLEGAYLALESELGREPTNEELASKLGIDLPQLEDEIRKSSLVSLISLDDYLESNKAGQAEPRDNNMLSPESMYEQQEIKELLAQALDNLTERERLVVALYYFEDMTLKEISKIMNLSESRVSQIHSKIMLKLRLRLGRHRSILTA